MNPFATTDTDRAEDWRDHAACASDADLMFPEPSDKAGIREARVVCAGCPVQQQCLAYVIGMEAGRAKDMRSGIWAGRTPSQRYYIYKTRTGPAQATPKLRGSGRTPNPCGTPAAYDRHCRNHEAIDDACRQAHNDKNREQKARQRAARSEAAA